MPQNLTRLTASILLLCFYSCTALRKPQKSAAEALAANAKLLAATIPDLHSKHYELEDEEDRHNTTKNFLVYRSDSALADLQRYNTEQQQRRFAISQLANAYSSLEYFGNVLLAITDSKYQDDLQKSSTELKSSLQGVINLYDSMKTPDKMQPASLAKLVYSFLDLTGGRIIKHKQLKLLKEYMASCSTHVYAICKDIKKDVEALAKLDMKETVEAAFKAYYQQLKDYQPGAKTFEYTEDKIIPYYRALQAKLNAVKQLESSIPGNVEAFISSYEATVKSLYTKMDFKELKESLKNLHSTFKEVKTVYDEYKKEREQLKETAITNNNN